MPSEKERALEIVQETENEILRRCRSPEIANRSFSPDDLRAAAILRAQVAALSAGRRCRCLELHLQSFGMENPQCELCKTLDPYRAAAAELEAPDVE